MRCAFIASAPEGQSVEAILLSLALDDNFYVNQKAFAAELKFCPAENGAVRVEVYGELAENLLAWAKQKSGLKFKPI